MKSPSIFNFIFLSFIIFIPFSCDKTEEETIPVLLTIESITSDGMKINSTFFIASEHGTNLLTPELNQEIIDWINARIDQ